MTIMDGGAPSDTEALLVMVQGYRREAVAEAGRLREQLAASEARLALTRGLVEGSMAQTERAVTQAESASEKTERALALLEGMITEAKRHRGRADDLAGENDALTERVERLEVKLDSRRDEARSMGAHYRVLLARAHAHHMFGVDVDGPPADRVGALCYLRNHGLPEAAPADLDAACEGLVTPWGSGPVPQDLPRVPCEHDAEGSPPADVCWICDGF